MKVFATQSNQERSGKWLNERLVNLYVHATDGSSKSPFILYRSPGLVEWATLGTDGPIRGQISAQDSEYMIVIAGSEVRKVLENASSTVIGTIARDSNKPVSMATNGKQVAICSGGKGYIATGTSVVEMVNVPWSSVSYVTYQDGYFIWTESLTGKFYISGLYDGLNINALDFASAEKQPDNLVACLSNDTDVFLFGTDTIEIWRNIGDADFPFERIGGATIPLGTRAVNAIAHGPVIFFIGESKKEGPRAYVIDGYTSRAISTSFIDRKIEANKKIKEAIGWTYAQEGHHFYVLQLPDEGTFVYDLSTDKWHERNSGYVGSALQAWRAYSHSWQWGRHIVGDWAAARLYTLDSDGSKDAGRNIIWEAYSTPFSNSNRPIRMDRIFVDVDISAPQGPEESHFIGLELSDDGGTTWTNRRLVSLAIRDRRNSRAVWWRNGRFLERQFRITGNYPVKSAIIGVDIIAEEGRI